MRLLRAIVILVSAAVAACTSCSGDSGSGSESNFLPCATDADCPRGACVNERCDPDALPASSTIDASDAAEAPDGTLSSGGTGGEAGSAGGTPDAAGAEVGDDAPTVPDSGAGADASPPTGCGPGPTALYFMLDRSFLMSEPVGSSPTSKWEATASGIIAFLQSPLSAGLDAAVQYYPLPDPCNPATYATPDVPFGALPGNESALTLSINSHDPSTPMPVIGRPVAEALQSALSYSKTSPSTSGDDAAIVLVTSGYPTACNTSMAAIAGIAQDAVTTAPAVRTFVIAIGDVTLPLAQYEVVTMAGGTGLPFTIANQTPGEVTAAVTDALVRIVGRACQPCLAPIDCAGGGVCASGYCVNPG